MTLLTSRKFNLEKRESGLWKTHFEWRVQRRTRGLKSNLNLQAKSLGNFWPCIKISENLTNITSAAQPRKLALFSVYLAARVIFFMHEWFDSHPSNHSCMKSFVHEKSYASCEVNGKKSKFKRLRGGLNVIKNYPNF